MNTYHLQVITGYGNVGDAGLTSFTVEADDFNNNSTCYNFYSKGVLVASYPINRTIIQKIEKI
jgi:hypothetical protein